MKTINGRRKFERGSQIAELAIVIPLLAFLAFVVSEGAGVVRAHQVLNNAAREGARLSAQKENQGAITAVQRAVSDYACYNRTKLTGVSTSSCTNTTFNTVCSAATVTVNQEVLIPLSTGVSTSGSQVTVTCTYPLTYLPALDFPTWGFSVPNTLPLKSTATFMNMGY